MHPPTGKRCRQISNTNNNNNNIATTRVTTTTMMKRRINATGMAISAKNNNSNNNNTTLAATTSTTTLPTRKTFGKRCRQLSVLVCFVAIIALNNFGCLLTSTTAAMQRENMRVLPLPE
ncbi:PREDICTED: anaphase-promoting complex subunit cdh1-like, partial [Rhagoletis zephyria]|uniref:anaphase-promoting complex subunit cdh1-like n=1 Tax=Rhagoletis zephyria TaxID=28612 RepID=UPI0008119808